MNTSAAWYTCVLFILTVFAKAAVSLRCYHCESTVDNKFCDDDYKKHSDEANAADSLKACDDPDMVCYKTVNRITDAQYHTEYRITTRGCTKTSKKPEEMNSCEKTPISPEGMYTTCYCRSEKCNGASESGAATFFVLTAAATLSAALLFKH